MQYLVIYCEHIYLYSVVHSLNIKAKDGRVLLNVKRKRLRMRQCTEIDMGLFLNHISEVLSASKVLFWRLSPWKIAIPSDSQNSS